MAASVSRQSTSKNRHVLQKELSVVVEGEIEGEARSKPQQFFELFVNATIIFNVAQLGICVEPSETHPDQPWFKIACSATDNFFVFVFVAEAIVKLYEFRRGYWRDKWNWLDFGLATTGMFDAWLMAPIMAVLGESNAVLDDLMKILKLIRILRVIKLMRVFMQLRIILEGLLRAMQSMIWVSMLLAVIVYCGAVFGRMFFRAVPGYEPDFAMKFDTLGMALFTMFTIAIAADWTDIVSPVVRDVWWGWLFFVVFAFTTSFGILNLIIGIITERTAAVQREYEHKAMILGERNVMRSLQLLSEKLFSEREEITHAQMSECLGIDTNSGEQLTEDDQLTSLLEKIPLPKGWGLHDCHKIFDLDHSGSISQTEFEEGMISLLTSTPTQSTFILQGSISDVAMKVCHLQDHVTQELRGIRKAIDLMAKGATENTVVPNRIESQQPDRSGARPRSELHSAAARDAGTQTPDVQKETPAPSRSVLISTSGNRCDELLQGLATAAEAARNARLQLHLAECLLMELRDDSKPGREDPSPALRGKAMSASAPQRAGLQVATSTRERQASGAQEHAAEGISSEATKAHADSMEDGFSFEDTDELLEAVNQMWRHQQAISEHEPALRPSSPGLAI